MMRHRIALTVALLATAYGVAAQDPRAHRIDECVVVLMDPHAGSADKLRACRVLYDLGDAAKPAAMALARQSLYDMEPVRVLARQTLNRVVGNVEGDRLRTLAALAGPADRVDVLQAFERVKGWEDFPRVATGLRSNSTTIRHAAVGALLRIWDNTRAVPASRDMAVLMRAVNPELLGALGEAYSRLKPAERKSALQLAGAIGANSAEAIPLLFHGLEESGRELQGMAKGLADRLFSPEQKDLRVIQALVRSAVDLRNDRPASIALRYVERLGPAGMAVAARCAIFELAWGEQRASEVLHRCMQREHPLRKAATFVQDVPPSQRSPLANVLQPTFDPPAMRAALAPLLTAEHRPMCVAAAQLAATAPDTFDPQGMLDWLIHQQAQVVPDVARALVPDAKVAADRMRPWLGGSSAQKVAAMGVLKTTGLAGDDIRAALAPLVESTDDDVRFAAAELLDRKDVLARVRVPQLLKDLSSDSHTARALAARQLDELGVEPREVTSALIRAVDRRDGAARAGLVDALAAAHRDRRNSLDVLKGLSESADARQRAYARAGLREVEK